MKRQPGRTPANGTMTTHQRVAEACNAGPGAWFAAFCVNKTIDAGGAETGPKAWSVFASSHGAGSGGSAVDLRDGEGQDAAGIDYGYGMSRASGRDWRVGWVFRVSPAIGPKPRLVAVRSPYVGKGCSD